MSHFNFSLFQNACLEKEPLFTSEHTPARNPRLHPQIETVVHQQAAGKIFTAFANRITGLPPHVPKTPFLTFFR